MEEKPLRELLSSFLETEIELLDTAMAAIEAGEPGRALWLLGNRVLTLRKDRADLLREIRRAS